MRQLRFTFLPLKKPPLPECSLKKHEHLNKIMEPASPDSQGDDTLSDPIWKGLNVSEM